MSLEETGERGSAGVANRGVLDPAVLAALVGDDEAVLREFFHDFALSLAAACAALPQAVSSARHDETASVAHRMKASARSVGALALGDICADIESAALRADTPALRDGAGRFASEAAAVQEWIKTHYAQAGEAVGAPSVS